jgi:hypothetical protein
MLLQVAEVALLQVVEMEPFRARLELEETAQPHLFLAAA